MKTLIISDAHFSVENVKLALSSNPETQFLLFLGDGCKEMTKLMDFYPRVAFIAVKGNCDWMMAPLIIGGATMEFDDEELITAEGFRILLMHGHKHGVKGGLGTAIAHAAQRDADVLIFGHTHIPLELHLSPDRAYEISVRKPLAVFNPGSLGDRHASFGTLKERTQR